MMARLPNSSRERFAKNTYLRTISLKETTGAVSGSEREVKKKKDQIQTPLKEKKKADLICKQN